MTKNMKEKNFIKILSIGLVFILSFSVLSGCGGNKEDSKDSVKVSQEENEPIENFGEEDKKDSAEQMEDFIEVEQELDGTFELIEAVVRSMHQDNSSTYDSTNPEFFWQTMHDTLATKGAGHGLAEIEGSEVKLPRQAVQEFASGLFADYSDLPEIPEDLRNSMRYDHSWDAYYVEMEDQGGTTAKILNIEQTDAEQIITVGLFSDADEAEEKICSYRFTVVPNIYADGVDNPMFPYSIFSAERISGTVVLDGTFIGLADNHTAEVEVKGITNTYQFQDKTVGEILNGFSEGTMFGFEAEIDEATGTRAITIILGD